MNKIPLTINELKSDSEFNYDAFTKEALISTIVSIRDYICNLEKELGSNNKRLSRVAENRYDKILELEQENQQLKEQQKEFKKTLRDKLIKYFDIENDSYFYILTRDKSAYQYGTMRFDDFKEFDIEQIDDLIKFLFNKRSDE